MASDRWIWDATSTLEALGAADVVLWHWEPEQDRLRLGMVATVRGVHNVNTATGTANSVEVWAIGQGRVYEVQSNQFKVAGMTIQTNSATWFYDVPSPLAEGAYVSVWGLQADSDGETWTASCVQASSAAESVISSGRVKFDDGERKINDLVPVENLNINLQEQTQSLWSPKKKTVEDKNL